MVDNLINEYEWCYHDNINNDNDMITMINIRRWSKWG